MNNHVVNIVRPRPTLVIRSKYSWTTIF